jgi:tRNA threonylcarbamoyladenosine biosynthesis protein TsaB
MERWKSTSIRFSEHEMTDAPIILSVETATPGGSICITRGDVELAARSGDPNISHSNTLLQDISDTLNDAGLSLNDIELFACAAGPGSFTGLRIGIATVKALAATLKRPVIGIPTLKGVAHAAGPSAATIAALPAGRGEVFAQMFSVDQQLTVQELDDAAHLSPQKLLAKYSAVSSTGGPSATITWAGSGAHAQRELLKDFAAQNRLTFSERNAGTSETNWVLANAVPNLARHVAALALDEYRGGNSGSPQSLTAIYVRPSDAELKQQCR